MLIFRHQISVFHWKIFAQFSYASLQANAMGVLNLISWCFILLFNTAHTLYVVYVYNPHEGWIYTEN